MNLVDKQLKQIYNVTSATKRGVGSTTGKIIAKKAQEEYLAQAYANKMITQAEFKQLAKKYGF